MPLYLLALLNVMASSPERAGNVAQCDLAHISSARELHDILGERAVEIVRRAGGVDWAHDDQLSSLVAADAQFNLGAGDVVQQLARGVEGARAMFRMMRADRYRFMGWNYIDLPVDGCARTSIDVEFDASNERVVSKVKFTFASGRLVEAAGWRGGYESGDLVPPAA